MSENWAEKYEEEQDKKRERELNNKLNQLVDLLNETDNEEDRNKILKEILDVTDSLMKETFDYNKPLKLDVERELAENKNKKQQEKYNNTKENQSWKDFQKEESQEEQEL